MSKKIKNPEKFIRHLRKIISRLKWTIKNQDTRLRNWDMAVEATNARHKAELEKVGGQVMITWKSYEGTQSAKDTYSLLVFKPGDTIAIIGEVTVVSASLDKSCGNKRSEIKYLVKETRKLEP